MEIEYKNKKNKKVMKEYEDGKIKYFDKELKEKHKNINVDESEIIKDEEDEEEKEDK